MEYSLQGYLEQRSTEELNMILNYLVNNYMHKPDDGVRMILAILQEREKDMPVTIPQELVLWAKNLGRDLSAEKPEETGYTGLRLLFSCKKMVKRL